VEETHRLMVRLNKVHIGGGGGRSDQNQVKGPKDQVRKPTLAVDLAQEANPGRLSLDLNGYLPRKGAGFYQIGINDFTEGNKVNLQLGQPLGATWLRYGLHASELGVGFDIGSPTHPGFSADLYGLNEVQLDLRGRARVAPSLDLSFGVRSLFDRNAPMVGVTWRR
jgi:hypothetical protein